MADTLTLQIPWDYVGNMLMQCFRFEANFCLVVRSSKSTANNMRKHRSGPHRFWPFEVLQRSCFTSLHDHTIKEYYALRTRSQETNLWKCLFIYSFGMDSPPFHRSLISFQVFLFVFLHLYYYFCFVIILVYWFLWGFWEKKEGRSRSLDRSIRRKLHFY